MWIENIVLAVFGLSFGLLVSGGVFTVLIAVGLMPRFAGKTHTADKVFLYEDMIIIGTITGSICSVFPVNLSSFLPVSSLLLSCFGLFAGIFVGCLALSIAEMLDTTPIFFRRISFRHGLGIVLLAVAFGKLTGSLIYLALGLGTNM